MFNDHGDNDDGYDDYDCNHNADFDNNALGYEDDESEDDDVSDDVMIGLWFG